MKRSKYDIALAAISEVFEETDRPKEEVKIDLEGLRDEIDNLIDSLGV